MLRRLCQSIVLRPNTLRARSLKQRDPTVPLYGKVKRTPHPACLLIEVRSTLNQEREQLLMLVSDRLKEG